MSYTNTTNNYELPQFLATDRMTPVADFNPAFAKIDAQMKINADTIASAQTNIEQALSDSSTAINTANSVASTANNALLTAETANITAGNANTKAETGLINSANALEKAEKALDNMANVFDDTQTYVKGDYVIYNGDLYKCTTAHTGSFISADFESVKIADEIETGGGGSSITYDDVFDRMWSMSSTTIEGTFVPSTHVSSADFGSTYPTEKELTFAKNNDGSLFKLYGGLTIRNATCTQYSGDYFTIAKFTNAFTPEQAPAAEYQILAIGVYSFEIGNTRYSSNVPVKGLVKTDGSIEFQIYHVPQSSNGQGWFGFTFYPTIFVNKNFGD